jgi:hypothetical protein
MDRRPSHRWLGGGIAPNARYIPVAHCLTFLPTYTMGECVSASICCIVLLYYHPTGSVPLYGVDVSRRFYIITAGTCIV